MARMSYQHDRDSDETPDVIQIILEEHQVLKDCIDVLIDEDASRSEKRRALKRFVRNLESHAHAEEETVYNTLESMKPFHKRTLEAFEEHHVAKQLMQELEEFGDGNLTDELQAKAKVLADVVLHHLIEEERVIIPKMKRIFDEHELREMGEQFARLSNAEREEADNRLVSTIKRMSHAISESY